MNIQNCNLSFNSENMYCILGDRLREAREAMGLSQQKVADSLCLKLFIIKSIEEGYVDTLKIASIFLYGYIRSYARLVGVDDKELLMLSPNRLFNVHDLPRKHKFRFFFIFKKYLKNTRLVVIFFMLFNIVIFIIYCLYYFFLKEQCCSVDNMFLMKNFTVYKWNRKYLSLFPQNSVLNMKKNDIFCFDDDISKSLFCLYSNFPAIVLNGFLNDIQNFDLYTYKIFCQNDNIVNSGNYENSVNENFLIMHFTGDCWIEVVDANGKTLCNGTQHAGYVLNLIGEIPYNVVIGVPGSVKIQYKGNIVRLDKFLSPYKVARLTIPS